MPSNVKSYSTLTLVTASITGVLIVLGGAVCFLGAAKAIPDWPASFGTFGPPAEAGAFVEYLHRAAAAVTFLLTAAATVVGLRRYRSLPWLSVPPAVAVVLLAVVATLGALVVLRSIPPALAAVDLGSALMVLALMVATTLAARHIRRTPGHPGRLAFPDTFSRLALGACAALYLVLASGLSVGNPAPANCLGLPIWSGLAETGRRGWLALAQLALSGVAGVLIVSLPAAARVARRAQRTPFGLAAGAVLLYLVLLLSGELAAARGFPWPLMAIRVIAATALWAVLVALTVREGLRAAAPRPHGLEGPPRRRVAHPEA